MLSYIQALFVELLATKGHIIHFGDHFTFRCAPQATDVASGIADRLHD